MQHIARLFCPLLAACSVEPTTSREAPPLGRQTGETIELAEAKLIIEHNATDEDTGFQGFVDGEAWKSLELRDSNGKLQLSTATKGNLRTLGLTELFFETNEPENAEVPIEELLALMPAGDYEFTAKTIDGLVAQGVATLSHTIPEAPEITAPAAGAVVSADLDLTITWNPSDTSQCGDDVTITHYQLIVEKADQPDHPGFGAETIDVRIPASVTSMRVPHEFLQPGTAYDFEVLAIEAGGNQTITAGEFSTL